MLSCVDDQLCPDRSYIVWHKIQIFSFMHKGKKFLRCVPLCIRVKILCHACLLVLKANFYAKLFGIKFPCVGKLTILLMYVYTKGKFYANC